VTIVLQFDTLDDFRKRITSDPEFVALANGEQVVIGSTTVQVTAEYDVVRWPPDGDEAPGPLYVSLELLAP
jgi:hypothetical protein